MIKGKTTIVGDVAYVVKDGLSNYRSELVAHPTEHATLVARMAVQMAEKWGMVTAEDGGEDSAGRAKTRLSTPVEVVERAVSVAEELARVLRDRGHIVSVPPLDELYPESDA